ncbi:MAG: hypothetical protein AAF433_22340 [Bacteroidota bacterium]
MLRILFLAAVLKLLACGHSGDDIPFVDRTVDQWDWVELSTPEGQALPEGVVDFPYGQYQIIHAFWADEAGARSLRIIEGADFPNSPDFEQFAYEAHEIRYYPAEEIYLANTAGFLLLSNRRLSIEAALDTRDQGMELRWPAPLDLPHYSWREASARALKAAAQRPLFSQYHPVKQELRSYPDFSLTCDCPTTELLGYVPYDATRLRIMPEPQGCYATFSIGRENYLLANTTSLQGAGEKTGEEEFGPFEIVRFAAAARISLSPDWSLQTTDLFAAQSYLERLIAGSTQLDQPLIQEILLAHPDFQYLRQWNRRDNTRELAETMSSWWIGHCEQAQLLTWQEVDWESPQAESAQQLQREFSFPAAITALYHDPKQGSLSLQLSDGSLYYSDSLRDWRQLGQTSERLLAPILHWNDDHFGWQTSSGWHDSFWPSKQLPARVGATYVYLDALDKTLVFLPDSSGAVHAFQQNGQSPATWLQSLRLGPAEVPILHIPGATFDHFFHLDTKGILSVFDFQQKLLVLHSLSKDREQAALLYDPHEELVYWLGRDGHRCFSVVSGEELTNCSPPHRPSSIDARTIQSDLPLIFDPQNQTFYTVDGQTLYSYKLEPDL